MTTQTSAQPSMALTLAPTGAYAVMEHGSADLAEILAANLGDQGLTSRDLDRITVPAGGATRWTVPSITGDTDEKTIEGVIVMTHHARAYWASNDVNGSPPDCSSNDMQTGSGDFGPGSPLNPTGLCMTCPMSKFGSGTGRGQACKTKQELFIVREQDMLPIVVSAPPTSLQPMRKYLVGLAGKRLPMHAVVTRLALAATANQSGQKYSQIVPTFVGALAPDAAAKMAAYATGLAAAFDTTGSAPAHAPAFDEMGEPLE